MKEYLIRLPWPPKGLTPHAKGHWRPRAAATRKYRHSAFVLAKQQRVERMPGAHLEFTYYPPDRRRRDCQNIPAMLKPAIDGIADAMRCDDHGFRVHYPDAFSEPTPGGAIICHIRPNGGIIPLVGAIS